MASDTLGPSNVVSIPKVGYEGWRGDLVKRNTGRRVHIDRTGGLADGIGAYPPLLRFAGISAFALSLSGVLLIWSAPEFGTRFPETFRRELLVLYSIAATFLLASVLVRGYFAYAALGVLVLLTVVVRITLGPAHTVLILTMLAILFVGVFVPTVIARRTIMFSVVLVAGFLPRPEYVFGAPPGSADGLLVLVPVVVGTLGILLVEQGLRLVENVLQEQERNDRLEAGMKSLARANVGFQTYSRNVGERSKQDERNRITREVHDSVGYALTNISIMLDAATGLLGQDTVRVRKHLQSGREQVDSAHWEIRRALHALRSLDRAETYGTKNVLRIAQQFQEATSVAVDIDLGNSRRSYGAHVDATLYRFVQEALANAFRHGRATHVEVRLWESETKISLSVRDNGVGTDEVEEGIGIVGIRERLSQVNGRLTWQSFGVGFVLRCEIPLAAVLGQ